MSRVGVLYSAGLRHHRESLPRRFGIRPHRLRGTCKSCALVIGERLLDDLDEAARSEDAGNAEHDPRDAVLALEPYRHRHRTGTRAAHVLQDLRRRMRGSERRRARPAHADDPTAGRNRPFEAGGDPLSRQKLPERSTANSGTGDDRHHLLAVAAEDRRFHFGHGDAGLQRQGFAKAGAVQGAGHADHPLTGESGHPERLRRHLVERIGDDDHHRRRRRGAHRLGHRPHRAPVRRLQIGASHARTAGTARGDDHDVGAGEEGKVGSALRAAGRAGDPGGVVEIESDRCRQAGDDVDEGDRVGHGAGRGQVRHAGAYASRTDDGDAPETHGGSPRGRLRRDPLRAAAIQPAPQRRGPVRARDGRAVQGSGAQCDVPPRRGVAGLVGDDAARKHLDVPAAAAARPLDVLRADDASFRRHGAFRPSTASMADTAASIAVSTEASPPERKNLP